MAWRWISDGANGCKGAGVGEEGTFYALPTYGVAASERAALSNRLELQGAVWGILFTARGTYVTGTATYENAVENLTHLLSELFKAQAQVEQSVRDACSYLTPSGVPAGLETMQDRLAFAKELVAKLASKKPAPDLGTKGPIPKA